MTSNRDEFLTRLKHLENEAQESFRQYCNDFNMSGEIAKGQDQAHAYAHQRVKHIFLINGGALIAMPAIIAAFEISDSQNIWYAGICFAAGLVLAVIVSLLAYWSVISGIDAIRSHQQAEFCKFRKESMEVAQYISLFEHYKTYEAEYRADQHKEYKHACRLEVVAIVVGLIAIGLFCSGVWFLTYAVWPGAATIAIKS